MFLACQKSKVTIKLKFYYSNLENAVETAKIAVDNCYVLRQFLTPLPSIDFREIRGLLHVCVNLLFTIKLFGARVGCCSIEKKKPLKTDTGKNSDNTSVFS
jgi:hypothetical protein